MVPSQTKRCNPQCPASTRSQTAATPASLTVTSIAQVHRCEHSPIEMKRHSSTFTCARTRLWLSMQHEKRRERLHLGQSSQATHQARQVAYGCSPALHLHTLACGTHAHKRDACAAQPRLNATLSRTCSKPHHLAFRMSMHPKHCNVTTHDSPAHAREHH